MFGFYIQSGLLGVGLAMDACAVSMANGLNETEMKTKKAVLIALMFGLFQALMPLMGYFVGHALLQYIEEYIPWIALILLGFIGGKTLVEGIKHKDEEHIVKSLTFRGLIVQAIATSIDALSVGLTIAEYTVLESIICATIIAVETFIISFIAVHIGKKFGTKLGNKAEILGGIILIGIGLEISISSFFK